jgi:hypothetical protein
MSSRAACIAVVALLTLQGCTTTVYAVVAPNEAVIDDSGCLRQCQRSYARETNGYLACLRNCQGVRIVDNQQCGQVSFDAQRYQCSTTHGDKTVSTLGLILVGLAAAATIAIFAIFVSTFQPYGPPD